jgi:hypothetical protein
MQDEPKGKSRGQLLFCPGHSRKRPVRESALVAGIEGLNEWGKFIPCLSGCWPKIKGEGRKRNAETRRTQRNAEKKFISAPLRVLRVSAFRFLPSPIIFGKQSDKPALIDSENRSPNPRNPKEARNPKSEPPSAGAVKSATPRRRKPALSGFGLRISFGFRISNFGLIPVSVFEMSLLTSAPTILLHGVLSR